MGKLTIKSFFSGYLEVRTVCEKCGHESMQRIYNKPKCPKCGHHRLFVKRRQGRS